jgi:DNA-binding transcriptional MerR regulator
MTRALRMADLVRESGIPRETIHYYLREGLLPEPIRDGRTRATYDARHVERLSAIRYLREEKFLPIAVIRSMLQVGLDVGGLDVETVSTVLGIDPSLPGARKSLADAEAARAALEHGLLGPEASSSTAETAAAQAVLRSVSEALELDPPSSALSLADMAVCARELTRMVDAEAGAFFEFALASGSLADSVAALARGRPVVARYVAAYRTFALQRVVTHLLDAASDMRLSEVRMLSLGPAAVERFAGPNPPRTVHERVWQLLATGRHEDLASLSPDELGRLRLRTKGVVRLLTQSPDLPAEGSLDFPLGNVLLAEVRLQRTLRSKQDGRLEQLIFGLAELLRPRPRDDADPTAAALAALRRGMLLQALPSELGLARRAKDDLRSVVEIVGSAPGRVDPAGRVCLEGNARVSLAQLYARQGQWDAAARELERAAAFGDDGALGAAVRSGSEALPLAREQDTWPDAAAGVIGR